MMPVLQRLTLQPRITQTYAVDSHREAFHEFHYIVSGSGEFCWQGQGLRCRPGDVFYTEAGVPHYMSIPERHGYVLQYVAWMSVEGTDFAADLRRYFPMGQVRHLGRDQVGVVQNIAEQWQRHTDFDSRAASMRFLGLLYQALNGTTEPSTFPIAVTAMIDYIHAHLCQSISLADLATLTHLEITSAARLFRKHVGEPPMVYHTRLRMQVAREMLSNQRVAQVAAATGFSDPFYFSRVFRKVYGVTPSSALRNEPA